MLRRLTAVGLAALLVAAVSGCATGRYLAAELPPEWQADPTENVRTLDLVKIATPTVQNDVIGPGDVIKVNISAGFDAEDNLEIVARVSPEGNVFIAELGHIQLDGFELVTAEAHIASLCRNKGLYKSPQVTVTMEQPQMNKVTVLGAVNKPKTYELRSGSSSLLDAITSAEGLAEDAGTQVEIRHPGFRNSNSAPRIALADGQGVIQASRQTWEGTGPQTVRIDLVKATQGGGGYYLPDGSIVNVERRDPLPVHVAGLVRKPGAYDFPLGTEMTLLDAVAEAGGTSNPLANKVYIIRSKPGEEKPILIEASLRKAKHNLGLDNPPLAPGDYVSVEQTMSTALYEAVRLIGFGVSGTAF
jgi:polysaccharide export outer membrane protein